jgi:hypothetical protein
MASWTASSCSAAQLGSGRAPPFGLLLLRLALGRRCRFGILLLLSLVLSPRRSGFLVLSLALTGRCRFGFFLLFRLLVWCSVCSSWSSSAL